MRLDIISLFDQQPYASFGPLILQAVLKRSHHDSSILFLMRKNYRRYVKAATSVPTDEEIELLLERLKSLKTDVAGLSVVSPHFFAAVKITRQIQKRLGIPVIWGGIGPTIEPQKCIRVADFISIGESEGTVLEFAQCFAEGKNPDGIAGLWARHGTAVIQNKLRPFIQDLNTLPAVNFDKADWHCLCAEGAIDLRSPGRYWYVTMASRGCIFRCSYCSEHVMRACCDSKRNYRVRSPENVIEELKEALRIRPVSNIVFEDALFPFYPDWLKRFSHLYKKEIGIPFHTRFHPAFIRRRELDMLRYAGAASLTVSLESASDRVRRRFFHRTVSDAQHLHMHGLLRATKGLEFTYNLIVDNPFEEQPDKDAAIDFFMSLPGRFHLKLSPLILFPGTDITALAMKEGKFTKDHARWALKPDAFFIDIKYKRTAADMHWLAVIMLFCVYFDYRCMPKKLIHAISKSGFLKRHPQLLFFTAFVLYKTARRVRFLVNDIRKI